VATSIKESAPSSLSQDGALSQSGEQAAQSTGAPAAPRTDAIGIEIPVVLYASRYSAAGRGLTKTPPPVREETRTVVVFAQGAVVRLSANIVVGEMVVLTNQRTGADVLCRVAAVKTQPGIQNYVDLEFTQRAPGFWEGRVDPSARIESPAPEPAAGTVATVSPILEPKQPSDLPSWLATDSASAMAATEPVPDLAAADTPIAPLVLESPRPILAHSVIPASSNVVAGMSVAPRPAQSAPPTLTGERLGWTTEAPSSSKKALLAGVAAVAVVAIVAGALLLSRRGQAAAPETAVSVAAPSTPAAQPRAASRSEEAPASDGDGSASTADSAAANPPSWLPDTTQHQRSEAEEVTQPAPRRSAIAIGKLPIPRAKTPVTVSASEPPPVLSTQNDAATLGVLRTGVLSSASSAEAPPAPPASTATGSSPARPAGGQMQMPKLMSSPEPLYPAAARERSLEGVVLLDAFVDAKGNVAEVKVISGPLLLQQAAADALRRWKYQPARLDGQPIAVHTQVSVSFKIR
jgi:TonB family protein